MEPIKPISDWMRDRGVSLEELIQSSLLDRKVVEAIVGGRYTPSPQQRRRLAVALGVAPEQVSWGHTAAVEHIYGHGPQFGRSP